MASPSQSLKGLQEYVAKTKDIDYGPKSADEDEDYAARLNKTLQSLQNQVKQHETALEKVSPSVGELHSTCSAEYVISYVQRPVLLLLRSHP